MDLRRTGHEYLDSLQFCEEYEQKMMKFIEMLIYKIKIRNFKYNDDKESKSCDDAKYLLKYLRWKVFCSIFFPIQNGWDSLPVKF